MSNPHISFKKVLVRDLEPEMYRRLRVWNYREQGEMQDLYSRAIEEKQTNNYVVMIYCLEQLIGHSLVYQFDAKECWAHFWIGVKWRGRGYGMALVEQVVRTAPKGKHIELTTHDYRSEVIFSWMGCKFPKRVNVV